MPPEQKHPRHPVAQDFATLGTLMSLWITEDTIPVQKQYANFFTVDMCTPNWFATTLDTTGQFIQNNGHFFLSGLKLALMQLLPGI